MVCFGICLINKNLSPVGGNFFYTYLCHFITIWYRIGFMVRNSVAFFVYLHKEKLKKLWIK